MASAAAPSEAGSPSFGSAGDKVWPEERYRVICTIGEGCFGTVVLAESQVHGQRVALKCVKPDAGREVHEVELMKTIQHPNVVPLLDCFEALGKDGQKSLHIVMEYLPQNLHERIAGRPMGPVDLRCFGFQMLRALAHLDGMSICHRDLKPENILLGTDRVLKLCDFGSAKVLKDGPSSSYICARWWRAPELVLGCQNYGTSTDWWSGGCVIAEMMRGRPLLPGTSSWGQMLEIVTQLGPPTEAEVRALTKKTSDEKMVKDLADLMLSSSGRGLAKPWEELLPTYASMPEAIELVGSLLRYDPATRRAPAEALCARFFRPLEEDTNSLPPRIFEFTVEELRACKPESRQELRALAQKCLAELERLDRATGRLGGDALFDSDTITV